MAEPSAPDLVEENEKKMVMHMGQSAREVLSKLLGPVCRNNWKMLADLLEFSHEDILYFETRRDPVETFIQKWEYTDPQATIEKLKSCLNEMGRLDVLEDLKEFEAKTLTPSEYKRHQEARAKQIGKDEKDNVTVLQSYDAFICYACPDIEFAKEILRRLEDTYGMKLCIDYRDILPGGCELTSLALAIEKRCRKIIVILSGNFNEDERADFQAKIGLSLSPGCRHKRLIPIKYEECLIPTIYRFITHLDYTNEDSREYFWDKLARSLGYKPV